MSTSPHVLFFFHLFFLFFILFFLLIHFFIYFFLFFLFFFIFFLLIHFFILFFYFFYIFCPFLSIFAVFCDLWGVPLLLAKIGCFRPFLGILPFSLIKPHYRRGRGGLHALVGIPHFWCLVSALLETCILGGGWGGRLVLLALFEPFWGGGFWPFLAFLA